MLDAIHLGVKHGAKKLGTKHGATSPPRQPTSRDLGANNSGAKTLDLGASTNGAKVRVYFLKTFHQGHIWEWQAKYFIATNFPMDLA
jgi:hypothetical protein